MNTPSLVGGPGGKGVAVGVGVAVGGSVGSGGLGVSVGRGVFGLGVTDGVPPGAAVALDDGLRGVRVGVGVGTGVRGRQPASNSSNPVLPSACSSSRRLMRCSWAGFERWLILHVSSYIPSISQACLGYGWDYSDGSVATVSSPASSQRAALTEASSCSSRRKAPRNRIGLPVV
jgi:hypothetical protein